MIDYEKLKIAHELAGNLEEHYLLHAVGPDIHEITLASWNWDPDERFKDLDKLIYRLKELTQSTPELTQPKPKYEIGQEVWIVDTLGKAALETIDDIDNGCAEKYFINEERWFREDEIYSSKEALIEAKIKYWSDMLTKKCEHESDAILKMDDDTILNNCKKCGEIY